MTSAIELNTLGSRRRSSVRRDLPSLPQSVYFPPSKDVAPLPSLPASATTSAAPSAAPSRWGSMTDLTAVFDEEAEVGSPPSTPSPGRVSPPAFDLTTTDGGEAAAAPLHPPDTGYGAWSFLLAGTVVELLVWGLPWSVGVLHEYWAREMFPGQESTLTLAATLQTGAMYMTAAIGP